MQQQQHEEEHNTTDRICRKNKCWSNGKLFILLKSIITPSFVRTVMSKLVSEIEASNAMLCAACGSHYQQQADNRVTTHLEFIFFHCFSSKPGVNCNNNNNSKNYVMHFCPACEKLLIEWDRLTKVTSELICQANRIKLALTVKILEGSNFPRNASDDIAQKITKNKRSELILRKLSRIKNRIRKEYSCRVVVKRLCMKGSLHQEISKETAGNEIETEIIADQTILGDKETFDETLSPDGPDEVSGNRTGKDNDDYLGASNETERMSSKKTKIRCEPPPRKRPRRTDAQSRGFKYSDAESEASESDQDFKPDSSSSDSEADETIPRTKIQTELKDETKNPQKSREPSFGTPEVGPNEYLYKGEFRYTIGDNGRYYCGHCDGKASSRALIFDHIRRHHVGGEAKVSRLINPDMEQISRTEFVFLKKYLFRLDPSLNVYHCGVCDSTFSGKNAVTYHMKDAHLTEDEKSMFRAVQISQNEFLFGGEYKIIYDGGRFSCEKCGYEGDTRHYIYNHIRRFHVHQESLPARNFDTTVFIPEPVETTKASINMSDSLSEETNVADRREGGHIQRKCVQIGPHEYLYDNRIKVLVKKDKWVCGKCNLSYDTRKKATRHIAARHPKESTRLEWDHLGNGKYSLGQYGVEHDGKLYKCLTCGRMDNSRKLVFVHVRRVHANPRRCRKLKDAQQFKCNGIPYSYNASISKYVCGMCPKSFGEKSKLRRHIETCHLDIERKKFICDICGLELSAERSLKLHRQLHEGSNPFMCTECGKSFKLLKYLKDHQRIHRGDDGKKYQCEFCGKKYWTKKEIQNHVTTHTNEKPFPCCYCNLSFSNTFQRRKHSKAVHDGMPFQK